MAKIEHYRVLEQVLGSEYKGNIDLTFAVLLQSINHFYDGLRDKKPSEEQQFLLEGYSDDCEQVLYRAKHIAETLKEEFKNTPLLDSNFEGDYSDDLLKKITQFIFYTVSPLYTGQNNEVKAGYPAWDKIVAKGKVYEQNQEKSFYSHLMIHIFLTQVVADHFVPLVNKYIEYANEKNLDLEEGTFGYLRDSDAGQNKYKTIKLNQFKAKMLLHDLGRWVTHHHILHESYHEIIFHSAGISSKMSENFFDPKCYEVEDENLVLAKNLRLEVIISHMIDVIAKRAEEGKPMCTQIRHKNLILQLIGRLSNYNGDMQKYQEEVIRIKAKNPEINLSEQDHYKIAMGILEKSPSNAHQITAFKQEKIFVEEAQKFLTEIFVSLGLTYEDVIASIEADFEDRENKAAFWD